MPELPEVETVIRHLRPVMVGEKITTVKLNRTTLRFPIPKSFVNMLRGVRNISSSRCQMGLCGSRIWVCRVCYRCVRRGKNMIMRSLPWHQEKPLFSMIHGVSGFWMLWIKNN